MAPKNLNEECGPSTSFYQLQAFRQFFNQMRDSLTRLQVLQVTSDESRTPQMSNRISVRGFCPI